MTDTPTLVIEGPGGELVIRTGTLEQLREQAECTAEALERVARKGYTPGSNDDLDMFLALTGAKSLANTIATLVEDLRKIERG